MRFLPLLPLLVTVATIVVIAAEQLKPITSGTKMAAELHWLGFGQNDVAGEPDHQISLHQTQTYHHDVQQFDTELLLDIEAYEDPDYGFSVAIPSGWQKIVAAESDESFSELEPGYAVGFESPHQGDQDRFADYVLIEVLPGKDSGLFETDGQNRQLISINGQAAWMDRLDVKGESNGLTEVDLTIFQAQMSGLGYTIGLYAIGEPSREKLMSDAFEVIVRTFKLTTSPFPIS